MKRKLSVLILLLGGLLSAFGQGQVYFGNASTLWWTDPTTERRILWSGVSVPPVIPGTPVCSNSAGLNFSSLRAVLYYASSTTTDLGLFTQATGGASTFKPSTSLTAGSWFGHTTTLNTIPNGVTANLFVVLWDINRSTDPLSAAAMTGLWGMSQIFQYTPPTNPTPSPRDFLMTNFRSFDLTYWPEPSCFSLASLAALLWLGMRRHESIRHKSKNENRALQISGRTPARYAGKM